MADAVIVALVVAIPSTVTALAAAILSLRNGFKADAAAVVASAANKVATDTHAIVNSQREEMLQKIAALQAEIVTLVREADGRRRQ